MPDRRVSGRRVLLAYAPAMSSAPSSPRVGVVIVNFNGGTMIARALECVRRQTTAPQRVVVVDNKSTDGSLDLVRDAHPWVEVIEPGENTGFARGNNIGIRALDDCEWIALLNPDAYPEPDWLATLLGTTRRRADCSFFASLLLDATDPATLDGAGDAYHVSGLAWRRDHGRPASDVGLAEREVFGPCAAAAMYRRSALLEVGLFDERWFCYFEDVDLAFRLRLAGHRCLLVPGSRVLHEGSATTGRESPFTLYHSHRNLVWTWLRDMPAPLLIRSTPHFLLTTALAIGWYGSRGELRTLLRAKRDGFAAAPRLLLERRRLHRDARIGWQDLRALMERGRSGYLTAGGRARDELGRSRDGRARDG